MTFRTIQVRIEPPVCTLRLDRPESGNGLTGTMVAECRRALDLHAGDNQIHVVVVEGTPEVFCIGADFHEIEDGDGGGDPVDPAALYDLWHHLARGAFVSIAHVRGKATAGGVGFAAACDVVLADATAVFSLSELLFGLFPACVLPFLVRRVGGQRAHYMTLTTNPVRADQALEWGLVDALADNSEDLLRRHLLRLRRLTKPAVARYKAYFAEMAPGLAQSRDAAVAANRALFSDPEATKAIRRFSKTNLFPWEN